MIGAAIIVFILVVFIPVAVMSSGAVAAGIIGWFLRDDARQRYEGSELLDVNV